MDLIKEGLGIFVQPTSVSRKLVIDGKAKTYPVYRVRLDMLYYNDQNDRIATWIGQYKSKFGEKVFERMERVQYNNVIQQFIVDSNPAAIDKTQINIQLVNQRESGVVLSDGRVIDGNRRFTCLRRLAEKEERFNWFETVILDVSLNSQRKQIKMLELAIQHGEEKKVDYNPLERLVGVYQDIVETKLLTEEEYAFSTNETVYEVRKRVELAMLIVEFLEFIHLPKQFHVAREYQVVSALNDLQDLLRRIPEQEQKEKTKQAVFTNLMMKTLGDSRKYIRNLNSMMNNGFFQTYVDEQARVGAKIRKKFEEAPPENKYELDAFVRGNEEFADQLTLSMDKSLLKAKRKETRDRPSQIVSKSINMLSDVDTRVFEKLTDNEKDKLRGQMEKLSAIVESYHTAIPDEEHILPAMPKKRQEAAVLQPRQEETKHYRIAKRRMDEPFPVCMHRDYVIRTLSFTLDFSAMQGTEKQENHAYILFFVDEKGKKIHDEEKIVLNGVQTVRKEFLLPATSTGMKEIYLAIRSERDAQDELLQLITFRMDVLFAADADF